MKRLLLLALIPLSVQASEVDFSRAYFAYDATQPTVLQILGIRVTAENSQQVGTLLLSFDQENQTFSVPQKLTEQSFSPELSQQQLRNTRWTGEYRSVKNIYLTELQIKVVQAGFIAGEMLHKTPDPDATSLLRTEVAGDISTQYWVDTKGDGNKAWLNVNDYNTLVAKINAANAELKPNKDGSMPATTPIPAIESVRQLITLKRLRALEYRHDSSTWGSQSEYRMSLENNKLSGSVVVPADKYGAKEANSGNGIIELHPMTP